MILTEVGKVRIPEPDIKENEYVKKLYESVKEMQRALERDLSSICLDNFSKYGIKQLEERCSEVQKE